MLSLTMLVAGITLEFVILFRAFRGETILKYPLFYAYLACVLSVDVSRDVAYFVLHSPWYRQLYWGTEFLTLLVGYGVILEITRLAFERYEGAERFARAVIFCVFVLIFAYVGLKSLTANDWSPASSVGELERDLRGVQALVIAGVVVVALYYGIRMGRNLIGIVAGYGLFTATAVMTLAVRSYAGPKFDAAWKAILPYSYLACLLVWAIALWSYHPNPGSGPFPPSQTPHQGGDDYRALAARTRGLLGSMRASLERSARS
jgi:hypothetical protein